MKTFNVYPLYDIEPVRALNCSLWDANGREYLDLYGGHAVISIGHTHPHYVKRIEDQLHNLGFYSNSVHNSIQEELAELLTQMSGYPDYRLFMINSGAEAIENALKLASFHTGHKKVLMVSKAFHGRTSAAVAITDNAKIQAPVNPVDHVVRIGLNDIEALKEEMTQGGFCAIVIEGIQGVGGIHLPSTEFLQAARALCDETGTVLILDEIQSGYGRTGKFFAHQHAGIKADLITMAKGMGNGFPVGAVLIGPQFEAWHGMLGTTFGGNHLACAASLAVLEVIRNENLMENATQIGDYLKQRLQTLPQVTEVRGLGLMLGVALPVPAAGIRKSLLFDKGIFTGSASDANTIRLLPPLTLSQNQADQFLEAFASLAETVIA